MIRCVMGVTTFLLLASMQACTQVPDAAMSITTRSADLTLTLLRPGARTLQALADEVASVRLTLKAGSNQTYVRQIDMTNLVSTPITFQGLAAGIINVYWAAFDADSRLMGNGAMSLSLQPGESVRAELPLELEREKSASAVLVPPSGPVPEVPIGTITSNAPRHVQFFPDLNGGLWGLGYASGQWNLVRLGPDGQVAQSLQGPTVRAVIDRDGFPWGFADHTFSRYTLNGVETFQGRTPTAIVDAVATPDGHLWYATNYRLIRLALDGSEQARYFVGGGIRRLQVDRKSGHLWVALHHQVVRQVAPDGTVLSSTEIPVGTPFREPKASNLEWVDRPGMAVASDGACWVTTPLEAKVTRIMPDGSIGGEFAVGAAPAELAFDQAGNVWIRSGTNARHNLLKMSPTGTWLGLASVPEVGGLASDSAGHIWVRTDSGHVRMTP